MTEGDSEYVEEDDDILHKYAWRMNECMEKSERVVCYGATFLDTSEILYTRHNSQQQPQIAIN